MLWVRRQTQNCEDCGRAKIQDTLIIASARLLMMKRILEQNIPSYQLIYFPIWRQNQGPWMFGHAGRGGGPPPGNIRPLISSPELSCYFLIAPDHCHRER